MKRGIVLAAALALWCAGCDIEVMKERPAATNANLSALKISGKTAPLGTQASKAEDASPGTAVAVSGEGIAISATAAATGASVEWFLTSADSPNYDLEWGSETAIPIGDAPGNYLLVIRVTSPDGSVIRYYKAVIAFTYKEDGEEPPPDSDDAQTPVFTVQPASANYFFDPATTYAPLTALAEVSDGGTISYAWFKADDLTGEGEEVWDDQTYEIDWLDEGTHYFYAVATNTNNAAAGKKTATKESERAVITVSVQIDAVKPDFTVQPTSAFYLGAGAVKGLTAAATVSDGGTVSYQWYSAAGATGAGSPIPDQKAQTYNPGNLAPGTYYYYMVATNTNDAPGITVTTAIQESERAKITVNAFTPKRNPSAVTANNTALLRIDLAADFDIKLYTHFTIELEVFGPGGSTPVSLSDWDGALRMQWEWEWEYDEGELCAEQKSPPLDMGGGNTLPVSAYDWRWDLFGLGPNEAANTDAEIPAYLFRAGTGNVSLEYSPAPPSLDVPEIIGNPGSYTIHPLRYLYFLSGAAWSGAGAEYLEVRRVVFY